MARRERGLSRFTVTGAGLTLGSEASFSAPVGVTPELADKSSAWAIRSIEVSEAVRPFNSGGVFGQYILAINNGELLPWNNPLGKRGAFWRVWRAYWPELNIPLIAAPQYDIVLPPDRTIWASVGMSNYYSDDSDWISDVSIDLVKVPVTKANMGRLNSSGVIFLPYSAR